MTDQDRVEVFALRYASVTGAKSRHFLNFHSYGEPDESQQVDYFFWLVRTAERTVLFDCGFERERAAAKGRHHVVDPLELLARVDVAAAQVDHVVLSHMHYDHVGNVDLFPEATFSLAAAEYDYWSGPFATRSFNRWLVDREDVSAVRELRAAGRLVLVEDEIEVFPGARTVVVGGHTAGQAILTVAAPSGHLLLTSDAAHFYEELVKDRPFSILHDFDSMHSAYDTIKALAAEGPATVIAGHDPLVTSSFAEVAEGCYDLTRPVRELPYLGPPPGAAAT